MYSCVCIQSLVFNHQLFNNRLSLLSTFCWVYCSYHVIAKFLPELGSLVSLSLSSASQD